MKLKDVELYLRSAVSWFGSPQPVGALLSHHGITAVKNFDCRSLCVVPIAADGQPAIVISGEGKNPPVFTDEDLTNLKELVSRIVPVSQTWNGKNMVWNDRTHRAEELFCTSYSIGLAVEIGTACKRLVDTYRRGCRAHGDDVFCNCGWYARGEAMVNFPEGWL